MDKNKLEFLDRIEDCLVRSTEIMLDRNSKRGDACRGTGLLGQFVDIYSRCSRLKRLIWDQGLPCDSGIEDDQAQLDIWIEQVLDTLRDLRNFTILAEFSIEEQNWKGDPKSSKLGEYMDKECDTDGHQIR